MTQLVLNLSRTGYVDLESDAVTKTAAFTTSSREIVVLGLVMIVLQIMDGLLTAIGVLNFGTSTEGNVAIKFLMDTFGCVPALLAIKTFAIGVIFTLCTLATRVSWLTGAMKAVILIYLGAAIIPWSAILLSRIA